MTIAAPEPHVDLSALPYPRAVEEWQRIDLASSRSSGKLTFIRLSAPGRSLLPRVIRRGA